MTSFTGGLGAVFGAAFGSLYGDGVLHQTTTVDNGAGGFSASTADSAVKVLIDTVSDADRVAGGLPRAVVTLTVLRSGLAVSVDIDDTITADGVTYRVIDVGTDPAGAAYTITAVPA